MKALIIVIFNLLSLALFSQDNIIQKEGSEIKKRVSVEATDITYAFDKINLPVCFSKKKDFFLADCEYQTKDFFGIKNYLFLNTGLKIGIGNFWINYYSQTALGLDLEMGNVFYFAKRIIPQKFGVGLNWTWLNTGVILSPRLTSFIYSSSIGPQVSFQPILSLFLDLYLKPGISLIYTTLVTPTFLMDFGFNFRYKAFFIGINCYIVPQVTPPNYPNTSYDLSQISIKIGANFQKKSLNFKGI